MPEGAGSDWDRTTVWPECVGQQRRNRHEGEQGQPWLSSNRTGRHGITLMHRRPPRPMSHTSGELVSVSSWSSVRTMKLTASLALKLGPPFRPTNGRPSTVNSTVSSVPSVPPGKSDGAYMGAPTLLSGKVAA